MRLLAGVVAVLAVGVGAVPPPAGRIAGRIVILEKDNKPSPDLGDAVLYLEGPHSAADRALPTTVEIAITDKVYAPHVVVVPIGSTVRFPNHDPFNHNVFSVSEPSQFDLGLYGRGEVRDQTFTRPGLVRVYCNVHPRMVAYVFVMENRYYAQPGADGAFSIDSVPPGRYRLHVWHERIPSEVVQDVTAGSGGSGGGGGGWADLQIALNARGYKWQPHRNKYGKNYPTNAGRERY